MVEGQITLEELDSEFSFKRNKIRLSRDLGGRLPRPERESVTSTASNGSSLMIDAGEQS